MEIGLERYSNWVPTFKQIHLIENVSPICIFSFQERVDHLESLRNRLEATLSPQLVAAFSSMDRDAAVRLVKIFRGMERDKQLTKYYR